LDGAAAAGESFFKHGEISSGQTQSLNSFFIIVLAPLFAAGWLWLERRGRQPSTPTKMVLGLAFVSVAFGVMLPAALNERRETTVPLAELPPDLDLHQYGATRLVYSTDAHELRMRGVLPDVDRIKLKADAASAALRKQVDDAIAEAKAHIEQSPGKEKFEIGKALQDVPGGFGVSGIEAPKVFRWDASNSTLYVSGEVGERAKSELLSAAAPSAFASVVDQLYMRSAEFRVSVWWLIGFYIILTMGELCVSPVGLSLVTKLAPAKHVGLLMGGWFLATAIAERVAHLFGAYWGTMPPLTFFLIFVVITGTAAGLLALAVHKLKRMMHGVH
jgi:hypothetical protein